MEDQFNLLSYRFSFNVEVLLNNLQLISEQSIPWSRIIRNGLNSMHHCAWTTGWQTAGRQYVFGKTFGWHGQDYWATTKTKYSAFYYRNARLLLYDLRIS